MKFVLRILTLPGVNPVEHTHTHTYMHMHRVTNSYWSGGQPITAPGEHGGTVPCHGHTFQNLENLITTFDPPWLKSKHTKFEAMNCKYVGGVRSYARCGNRRKFPLTSRWHYRLVWLCVYVRSQIRVPGKPMKFGEDQAMFAKVMSDFVFCGEQCFY